MDGILFIEDWSLDDAGLLEVGVVGHLDGEVDHYSGRILLDSDSDWPKLECDQIQALQSWAVISWELVDRETWE